jgi:hypothetical protein
MIEKQVSIHHDIIQRLLKQKRRDITVPPADFLFCRRPTMPLVVELLDILKLFLANALYIPGVPLIGLYIFF